MGIYRLWLHSPLIATQEPGAASNFYWGGGVAALRDSRVCTAHFVCTENTCLLTMIFQIKAMKLRAATPGAKGDKFN